MLAGRATEDPLREGQEHAAAAAGLEAQFIDNWGRLASAFGMGESIGRVHAAMFLVVDGQDASAVAAQCGMSLPSAEAELERLVDYGAVSRCKDRPTHYIAQGDPWVFFGSVVRRRAQREFAPLLDAVRALDEAARQAHARGGYSQARTLRITTFCRFVDQVSRMIETFGGGLGSRPIMSAARIVARVLG